MNKMSFPLLPTLSPSISLLLTLPTLLVPLLIPGKKMLQHDIDDGYFYAKFTSLGIRKMYLNLKNNKTIINCDHDDNKIVNDVLYNFYIIDEKNKLELPNEFSELPIGTLMAIVLYNNTQTYNEHKTKYNGFSLQCPLKMIDENGNLKLKKISFKRVSKTTDFNNFYLDIKGGGEDGGRKEHGYPHFHIIEKNTNKDIGKFNIPSDNWFKLDKNGKTKFIDDNLVYKTNITRKIKKDIITWLDKDDNIKMSNEIWLKMNKDNILTYGYNGD